MLPQRISRLRFILTPKQIKYVGAYEQFPAYIGAIGTGKSTALISKAEFHSREDANNLGVVVRKNFTDLRDSTLKDYEMYTGRKVNQVDKEDRLDNGSAILFRHGTELDTLKNINLGWAAIEQAEEFPDDTVFQFLKMRLRRQTRFHTLFIVGNTNGHNWVYDIWKKNDPPKNHLLIEATTHEHAHILPADYIANLETLPKKLYRRYVLNSWEEAEGLVYDEFLHSRDVIEPFYIPELFERGFCLDHGFRNPTAVLWYAIDFDGNLIIYDEHYKAETPISEHAQAIKQRQLFSGIADPSIFAQTMQNNGRVYSVADEYKDFGITLTSAMRSKEDASIARVNEFFKAGRIKIFKNCVNTIHEIGNWKWKEIKPGMNAKEEPQDLANHACDDLKYIIASRFPATALPAEKVASKSLNWFKRLEASSKKMMGGRKEGWEGNSRI